jgi:hypothetical protein
MKNITKKAGKTISEYPSSKITKAYAQTKVPFVIIRSSNAGVFAGELAVRDDTNRLVMLRNAIRIWYWDGAFTLSQIAMEGVSKPQNCKFSVPVAEHEIFEVIEIMPTTAVAEAIIKGVEPCRK